MINKAFLNTTAQILKSTQTLLYKINAPSIEEVSTVYKQDDLFRLDAALNTFKKTNLLLNGDTILHHFNKFFDSEVIQKIIDRTHISPNIKNNNGENALLNLCKDCSKELHGELLFDKSFNKNDEYIDRFIEINNKVKQSAVEIAQIYIKQGGDINSKDIFGNTSIYYAIKKGNLDLSNLIAQHQDFNPNILFKNDDNKDAFDLAINYFNENDLPLAIFLKMNQSERQNKIISIRNNLHCKESLLHICESLCSKVETLQYD